MHSFSRQVYVIAAATVIALLGIFQVIGQPSMITLVVVLLVTSRSGRHAACPPWRKA